MKKIVTIFFVSFLCISSSCFSQYCMLPGRTPYSTLQPGITNFQLNTINRTSSNSESATSVVVTTGLTTTLVAGQTYTISISHSEDTQFFAGDRNNIRVWIDYNQNFLFTNTGETVISVNLEPPGTTYTTTFTVPLSAHPGPTSLRATAKMSTDAGHSIPTPCDSPQDQIGYHGEMEDYTIVIENPGYPQTAFSISPTVCVVATASVVNTSTGNPVPTYSWTAEPATGVSFMPGDTDPNPQVKFTNPGSYTITCRSTNSVTSSFFRQTVEVDGCNFVGITENISSGRVLVGPNPATDVLNIQLPSEQGSSSLRLVNCLGEITLEATVPAKIFLRSYYILLPMLS